MSGHGLSVLGRGRAHGRRAVWWADVDNLGTGLFRAHPAWCSSDTALWGRAGAPQPGQGSMSPWLCVGGVPRTPPGSPAPPGTPFFPSQVGSPSPRPAWLAPLPQLSLPLLPSRPWLHPSSGQKQLRVLCVHGRPAPVVSANWPFCLPSFCLPCLLGSHRHWASAAGGRRKIRLAAVGSRGGGRQRASLL